MTSSAGEVVSNLVTLLKGQFLVRVVWPSLDFKAIHAGEGSFLLPTKI
jgi:hypothetical protein